MGGCPKNAVYFAFVEFKIHQVLALVTDPTFDSAELLLFGSAQMTEPFSAEHRTFFSLLYIGFFKMATLDILRLAYVSSPK